jgi:hypothetical protein
MGQLRVVFVAGWGRSGSTLLENLLTHAGRAATVGESFQLWSRRSELARHCSCGEQLEDCPVWSRVQRAVTDDWSALVADMVRRRAALRIRNLPKILRPDRRWAGSDDVAAYAEALGRVYRAVAEAHNVDTVVDASKLPLVLAAAARVPDVDLEVVHLVRDPRGVMHSWSRPKTIEYRDGRTMTMRSYGPAASLQRWVLNHGLSWYVIRRLAVDHAAVRYEDLAAADPATLRRVTELTGIDLAGIGGGAVTVPPQHAIAGNPGRASGEPLVLRADDAWRTDLPRRYRVVGAVGLPLRAALVRRS